MKRYNPAEIEPKWQKIWQEENTYQVDLNDQTKPKYYGFAMLPYPSGTGLHTGHVRTYTLADVTVRAKRQQGFNAYNPIGWDAFGLPAENYAIKTGTPPKETIAKTTGRFREQMQRLGMSYDWSKEVNTSDPAYYKWTQWIFTKLHEHGLAYQKESLQWWCDIDKTVLANEQVVGGKCWRHDGPDDPLVNKKALKQWFFKITDYAEELLESSEDLDWPHFIKVMQKNWIGKSKGAEVDFAVEGSEPIRVFTTRPDTIFGATFLVLAPEHPLAAKLAVAEKQQAVKKYIIEAERKTEVERQATDHPKTGIFTGAYALNPANGEKLPVWVADYVLHGYGTGAIMAVPAHDERDYDFAKAFDLPVTEVVAPEFGEKRENEQWADGVTVMVYNQSTKKYLGLDWHNASWTGLVAGGLDGDETYEDCARRELREEAGISEIKELIPLGNPVFAHYRHEVKGLNRIAKTQGFLAIVGDSQGENHAREAHEDFENAWYDSQELHTKVEKLSGGLHWLELLRRTFGYVAAHEKNKPYDFISLHSGEGIMINSGEFNGLASSDMREKIVANLAAKGIAEEKINFKLRDWLISRQRYWGAPIPIVHCEKDGAVAVPEVQLPVELPEVESYQPAGDGQSVLATVTDWVNTTCPKCGGPATRETDTMDGYACSSWYFLRYLDPHNTEAAWNPELTKHWMPINFYNGADHAVSHLLYARFWTHFFHKLGLVAHPEPVKRLVYNAYILATDGTKMSKSKGNVVDPLEVVESGYGADALRVYEMFIAPYDMEAPWDTKGVPGTYRFLRRTWDVVQEFVASKTEVANPEVARLAHKTIKKVTDDIEQVKFNTAIAAMMELVNELHKQKLGSIGGSDWRFALESLVQLLAPFAPHIAAELWQQLGHTGSVHIDNWPKWDEAALQTEAVTIIVQINGKKRAELTLPKDADEAAAVAAARADAAIKNHLVDAEVRRIVYVPGRLVNFVV